MGEGEILPGGRGVRVGGAQDPFPVRSPTASATAARPAIRVPVSPALTHATSRQPCASLARAYFADGGSLVLFDKRRLGRVRLNPAIDALGPDAAEVTPRAGHVAGRPGPPRAGPGHAVRPFGINNVL